MHFCIRPRASLSFLLAFQLGLGPYALADQIGRAPHPSAATPPNSPLPTSSNEAVKMFLASLPGGQAFIDSSLPPSQFMNVSGHEKIVDQDPYFLRAQEMLHQPVNTNTDTKVSASSTGVTLQLPNSARTLKLNVPLKPFIEADDYILLQANESLFRDKADSPSGYGEGIFFIDKRDLRQESFRESGEAHEVPVFFIPTETKGWTKKIEVMQTVDDSSVLALANADGSTLSFKLESLDRLSILLHANLTLIVSTEAYFRPEQTRAYVQASLKSKDNKEGTMQLPNYLPPRGSTALFGTGVTGLNLDDPTHSLLGVAQNFRLFDLLIPRVHADILLTPDVARRLLVVAGAVLGSAVVGSLFAEFSSLKEQVKNRRQIVEDELDRIAIEKGLPTIDRSTRGYKVRAKLDDHTTVFTHSLTVVGTGSKVALADLVEYAVDRFGGHVGRSPDGLVRAFLSHTLLRDREISSDIPSNTKSLKLGTGVLGSVDTACVVIQLLAVSPWFFPMVGGWISPDMHDRMAHMFSGSDGSTVVLVTAEIFRNIAGYILNGAWSFAAEQKDIFTSIVKPQVVAQMRSDNMDPSDSAANKKELAKRLAIKVDRELIAQGMASQKEFLFGAQTIVNQLLKRFGWEADRRQIIDKEAIDQAHFPLEESRQGVMSAVLNLAVKSARDLLRFKTDDQVREAVQILEEVRQEFHIFRGLIRNPLNPVDTFKKGIRVRRMLTTLGYGDGSQLFGPMIQFTEAWKSADENPEAAKLSAQIYREALFSILENKDYYVKPSSAQISKNFKDAYADARTEATLGDGPELVDPGALSLRALDIIKAKVRREEKNEKTAAWEPDKAGWLDLGFEKRALARIEAHANTTLEHQLVQDPTLTSDRKETIYRDAFRSAYLSEVGLRIKTPEESELVRASLKEASLDFQSDFANEGIKGYAARLSPEEQISFWARRHTEAFVKCYVGNTVNNPMYVALTSPEQPGFLQRARLAVASVKGVKGVILTKTLRVAEGIWVNTSYGLTAKSWRHRVIPFSQDLAAGVISRVKGSVGALSAFYLVNYYVFQIRFTYPQFMFFWANLAFLTAANKWLTRTQINAGYPPMTDIGSKLIFAVLWTWVTYPLFIPFFFWLNDFMGVYNQVLASPLTPPLAAVAACGSALAAVTYEPFNKWRTERKKAARAKISPSMAPAAEPAY